MPLPRLSRDTRAAVTGLLGAFAAALLGAGLFTLIGFPAAPLTGAATLVTIAALIGIPVSMPDWVRTGAFVLLGLNIGSGVTPETLQGVVAWPLSIAILSLSLVAAMALTRWGLIRWMGFDRVSGTLAAAPGHLSYVIALSYDIPGGATRVAIVQSIRVLTLTLCVPVLVTELFGATGVAVMPSEILHPLSGLLLLGLAIGLGAVFQHLRLPAAYLLAGMAVSATGHGLDLTPGRLPDPVIVLAFLVMGILIGSRFVDVRVRELWPLLGAGAWVTGVTILMSLLAVGLAMVLLGIPPALLIVAFAPGGVETMAAIAVTLGLDPAFVAAHHVMRLVILTVLIPVLLRAARRG